MAYDAKVNDKEIWRAIEDASLAGLHHMTLQEVCQLEWATMELKPKHVTARLNTLLQKRASDALEDIGLNPENIIDIL